MSGGHDRDVAVCLDCEAEFTRAYDSPITLCEQCCDRHDAHTSALEVRWTDARKMAKAVLDTIKQRDVA